MLGLAVGDAAGVDVEHVDLAVDGEVLAVGADQDRGVEGLAAGRARSEMLPASRWMPSSRAQPRAAVEAGAVERLGPGQQLLPAGQQVPLLRQRDQLGAVGGGGAHQALGRGEVPGLVAVELSCTAATRNRPLVRCLIDQSIGGPV